jgi:hypothetical protein
MPAPKPVRVIDPHRTQLVIVGVGGTGLYVLQQAARLLYGLKVLGRRVPEVLLIDGDVVEPKNLVRAYFLEQDLHKNKALVAAERYARAYGLPIAALPEYLGHDTNLKRHVDTGAVVVGCLDNSATRRLLHEKLQEYDHVVCVDSGNAAARVPDDPDHVDRYELAKIRDSGWEGQVLAGVRIRRETVIPFPGEVLPDLIAGDDRLPTGERPCGEATVSEPQRHLTNLFAATTVLAYLTPLLSEGTLVHWRSFFDARRGYVRSDPAIDALLEVAA